MEDYQGQSYPGQAILGGRMYRDAMPAIRGVPVYGGRTMYDHLAEGRLRTCSAASDRHIGEPCMLV